jgi:repressor LexA
MASVKVLSKRQTDILEFIRRELSERGYSPTVREIVAHVGDKSPTSVHRHLKTLEDRGYILRDGSKSRSIRLATGERGLPVAGGFTSGQVLTSTDGITRLDIPGCFNAATDLVLLVRGMGQPDQQIAEGDWLLVRKQDSYPENSLVVAADEFRRLSIRNHKLDDGFAPLGLAMGIFRWNAPIEAVN